MTAKILIVDDEERNLETLEAILAGEDYEIHYAADGPTALARAQAVRPDLVLLDVIMPGMDGFEVTRRLRTDPVVSHVPILLVTGLEDDESRLQGLRAGADDFLTKPCRREEIRARVRTVVQLNRFRTIAEQRARFERLFELSPDGTVLVEGDGNIVAANPRAATLRLGKNLYGSLSNADAEILRAMLTEVFAGRRPEAREVAAATMEGRRVLHVRAAEVPEGDTRLALLVFDDITAEVEAREALRRMNSELESLVLARTRQLEEANGLLMSYANFVSHDLRSPLAVVKGYLSLLQAGDIRVGKKAAAMIEQAYGGTLALEDLIGNILQLAQQEHDRTSTRTDWSVDPAPVVHRLVRLMGNLFPNLEPKYEIAALPLVGVSSVLVERVFYNLLANALKYSASSKVPRVEVGTLAGSALPVIFVRDNGVGFDSRDADKLFREFSRLDHARLAPGMGLGLSLVARLLRAHGGRIWAEGAVGAGATFYVEFPRPTRLGKGPAARSTAMGAEATLCGAR